MKVNVNCPITCDVYCKMTGESVNMDVVTSTVVTGRPDTVVTASSIERTVSHKDFLCLKLKLLVAKCFCRLEFLVFGFSAVRIISEW